MKYQDEKIKAIGRLTTIALGITVLLALSLLYPDTTKSFVKYLPLDRHGRGDGYGMWLAVLAIMAPICWGVDLGLIFTSPEQEVRFLQWSKRWRKNPTAFEAIEFDTRDPDYHKVAWRYLLDRYRR